jgi:hypothetical protein
MGLGSCKSIFSRHCHAGLSYSAAMRLLRDATNSTALQARVCFPASAVCEAEPCRAFIFRRYAAAARCCEQHRSAGASLFSRQRSVRSRSMPGFHIPPLCCCCAMLRTAPLCRRVCFSDSGVCEAEPCRAFIFRRYAAAARCCEQHRSKHANLLFQHVAGGAETCTRLSHSAATRLAWISLSHVRQGSL